MKPLELVLTEAPAQEDVAAVLAALVKYNESQAGPPGRKPLAILVRDPETGETRGGLIGRIGYDWLFVEYLCAPEDGRGQGLGREMIRQAEAFAERHGCVGVWLDTFSFQARGFYEKLGFTVVGEIADHPRGHSRYFLQKRLKP